MRDLIILHGALGSSAQFSELGKQMSGDYNVHIPNFPGHGGANWPSNFTIADFSEYLESYIEKHNLATPDIFGYSMGGFVALVLAGRRPEIIGKIFTLATKFDWSPGIAAREIQMLDAKKIAEKIPAFAETLRLRHAPNDWKEVLRLTGQLMEALGNSSAPNYSEVRNAVRLSVGDRDSMVTIEETAAVFRQLPDASLLVLPETVHPIEKIRLNELSAELKKFFIK